MLDVERDVVVVGIVGFPLKRAVTNYTVFGAELSIDRYLTSTDEALLQFIEVSLEIVLVYLDLVSVVVRNSLKYQLHIVLDDLRKLDEEPVVRIDQFRIDITFSVGLEVHSELDSLAEYLTNERYLDIVLVVGIWFLVECFSRVSEFHCFYLSFTPPLPQGGKGE